MVDERESKRAIETERERERHSVCVRERAKERKIENEREGTRES